MMLKLSILTADVSLCQLPGYVSAVLWRNVERHSLWVITVKPISSLTMVKHLFHQYNSSST